MDRSYNIGICAICNTEKELRNYEVRMICESYYKTVREFEEDENDEWNR